MKFLDSIKNNKKSIIIYTLVILASDLLRNSPLYTSTIVFLFVVLFIPKNNFLKIITIFLIILLSSEIAYFLLFNQRITQTILDSIVETNYFEASQMMMSKHILLIGVISLSITISLFLSKNFLSKKIELRKIKKIIFIATLTLFATDAFNIVFKHRFLADIQENKKILGIKFYEKYPLIIGDSVYLIMSIVSNDKYKLYNHNLALNKSIIGLENYSQNKIIIIMGESATSSRFYSHGYHSNTTPNINKIFSQKNGCIIQNAHSSAPITRESVAMTFSFATPEDESPLFNEKNIIDLAKDAGFKTYWLGSQDLKGLNASKFGYIARKSDVIKLTQGNDNELSNLLKKVIQNDYQQNQFIVLHLAGSHSPYTNFDDIDKRTLPHVDAYDLTIHHTDRVINAINDVIKSKFNDYLLFYTSDHGEIVNRGHGLSGAKEQYFVPLMILDTNNFLCQYSESLINKNGQISGLMNKYIFAKSLGYKLDDSIIKSEIDYDRILDANNNILLFDKIKNYY